MADSLDDFFAKKDKKRRDKNKSSAISAGSLVKELEEGAKQAEFQVRKEGKTSTALEILGLDSNDADWKDFEEIEKRDYTGLKVKEMSIQDQEEETRRQIERADQAPEPVPWKSKEETVAAITSFNTDPTVALEQQLLEQMADNQNAQTDTTKSNSDMENVQVSKSNQEGDGKETQSTEATKAETNDQINDQKSKPDLNAAASKEESTDESDTKKQETTTSATKKYVPPHERGGALTLEPVKMKHLVRPGSGAYGAAINLQDENEYPSLG